MIPLTITAVDFSMYLRYVYRFLYWPSIHSTSLTLLESWIFIQNALIFVTPNSWAYHPPALDCISSHLHKSKYYPHMNFVCMNFIMMIEICGFKTRTMIIYLKTLNPSTNPPIIILTQWIITHSNEPTHLYEHLLINQACGGASTKNTLKSHAKLQMRYEHRRLTNDAFLYIRASNSRIFTLTKMSRPADLYLENK